MKTEFKTAIILGAIIVGTVISLNTIFSSLDEPQNMIQNKILEENEILIQNIDKSKFKKAPSLRGIAGYINTDAEKLDTEIEGKVVLYDIWTYSCINCVRTLPYITEWNEKYADDGLLIIGIHSPEFEFEKNFDNVNKAVEKFGIMYPVILDNEHENWKAFENRYWPRKYIADHEGYIRYDHIGEGKYYETEKVIQQLLEERAAQLGLQVVAAESLVNIEEFQHTNFRTPELYFGYKFAPGRNQLGSSEGFNPEQEVSYSIPNNIQQNYFYMEGTWKNLQDSMKLVSEKGRIVLPYFAKEVNIVTENSAEIVILLDGKPISPEYYGTDVKEHKVITTEADLYNIVNAEEASSHVLELIIDEVGFEIYTFTFG